MKKFFIAKYSILASLLVTATVLSGCRNEFDFERAHDGDSFADKKVEYKEAFETAFCDGVEINPTHTWGFEELQSEEALMNGVISRAVDVNRNQWEGKYIVPNAITDDERAAVVAFFTENSDQQSESFDYSDFFVQQVYRGTDSYTANNGGTVVGSTQMNRLMAGIDHVNDFNSGDGTITRVYNGTSSAFSYLNSTDSKYHNEYKILYVPNYGWYLGFDFCATGSNPNQQVAADGVYTDWILKVTPAIPVETRRILCEDLGVIGDFDYNDAVFDVLYITNTKARIILRAAGATLDIYIGKFDPAYEVHNLFGVSKGVMVNTARAGLEGNVTSGVVYRTPVEFVLDGLTSTNPIDIPIYVGDSNSNYALTAAQGEAPHKICVPMSVEWTNERLPINVQYKKFSQWVNNPETLFWEGENVWTGEVTPDPEHSGLTPAEIEGNNLATAVAAAISAIETAGRDDSSFNVQQAVQDAKNAINHAETTAAVEVAKSAGILAIQAAQKENVLQGAREVAIEAINSAVGDDVSESVAAAASAAIGNINAATETWDIENAKNAGLRAIQSAKEVNAAAAALKQYKLEAIAAINNAVGDDVFDNVVAAANEAINNINAANYTWDVDNAKNAGLRAIQSAKEVNAAAAALKQYKLEAIAGIQDAIKDQTSAYVNDLANSMIAQIESATEQWQVENVKNSMWMIENAKTLIQNSGEAVKYEIKKVNWQTLAVMSSFTNIKAETITVIYKLNHQWNPSISNPALYGIGIWNEKLSSGQVTTLEGGMYAKVELKISGIQNFFTLVVGYGCDSADGEILEIRCK